MGYQKALESIYNDSSPSEIKNAILKIQGEERNRVIAVWVCHYGFDELVPQENTIPVPVELQAYRDAKKVGRGMSLSPDFWHREDISSFVDAEGFIKATNNTNKEWLKVVLSWLDEEQDNAYRTMVTERIMEFDRFEKVGKYLPYKQRRYEQTEETEVVKDMFKGTVV